ncbi:MAG: WYL domain-containing transcriptional regulator [Chloroflexi bacterium]|nr:WYL domain-containing transcriptional regulator [Chloroflexota bacterium]
MTRVHDSTIAQRKERILRLLQTESQLTEAEIAGLLNLERRTVNNYLHELGARVEKDGRHWMLSPFQARIPRKLDIDAEQAVVLYLAIRLFVKQSDRRMETAETLLMKLADILSDDLAVGDHFAQAMRELAARPEDSAHHDTLRTLAQAMIQCRQVELVYQPYQGREFKTTFSPYLLEPSGIGFATYAIGESSIVGALRTYKVERIASARLLRSTFTIPDDFPGLDLLRNAWSIYYGEQTVRVALRFSPAVARRVLETNWRTASAPETDPDLINYIRVTLNVADTTDLKPWIRSWGANVEVLEPESLRDEMVEEVRENARLYGWHVSHNAPNSSDPNDLKDSLARLMNRRPDSD